MAFNFLERLGGLFGRSPAAPTEPAPAEAAPEPVPEPVAEAPVAEPYTPPVPYTVTEAEAAPADMSASAETAATTATIESYAPPEAMPVPTESHAPPISMPVPSETYTAQEPAAVAEAAPAAPEAPAAPVKSAEELEEERLWGEIDGAWSSGDFGRVTELLDTLKTYQPEDAAEIDQKIASAQYNQASALEQSGELDRALYLYQEAQRRNPNLGEAGFAIERVQALLAPPPVAAAPEPAPAEQTEQTYVVAPGDTLSAIAERFYGSAGQWQRIFEANGDQLDNPDLIQPGQVLRIPV